MNRAPWNRPVHWPGHRCRGSDQTLSMSARSTRSPSSAAEAARFTTVVHAGVDSGRRGGRTATSTRPNPLTWVSAAGFVGMAVGTAILYLRAGPAPCGAGTQGIVAGARTHPMRNRIPVLPVFHEAFDHGHSHTRVALDHSGPAIDRRVAGLIRAGVWRRTVPPGCGVAVPAWRACWRRSS